jgi:phage terminase large subunit-like protein
MERVKLRPRRMTDVPRGASLAQRLCSMPDAVRERILSALSDEDAEALALDFAFWAREKQKPPAGVWSVWVVRAGRGWGKTRTGAAWVQERAMEQPRWIALVARTPADARDYMIEGPGGILRNCVPAERPDYEPSKRRLTWPNGSWATVFSDEEPDQLRGLMMRRARLATTVSDNQGQDRGHSHNRPN